MCSDRTKMSFQERYSPFSLVHNMPLLWKREVLHKAQPCKEKVWQKHFIATDIENPSWRFSSNEAIISVGDINIYLFIYTTPHDGVHN